jgi:hypothetical protein
MAAWKDLLEVSGGKLELQKCFYYILCWKFDEQGDAQPLNISEQRKICPQLTVHEGSTNTTTKISQKETYESHTTLGCDKTMMGNQKTHKGKLKAKSDDIGCRVKNAEFDRYQADKSVQ